MDSCSVHYSQARKATERFAFLRVPRDVISRYKRSIRKPNQTVAWFKPFQTNDVFSSNWTYMWPIYTMYMVQMK